MASCVGATLPDSGMPHVGVINDHMVHDIRDPPNCTALNQPDVRASTFIPAGPEP